MLYVLICEDDAKHRARLEEIVQRQIAAEDCDMEFALSAGSPEDILGYLAAHPDQNGLYFLDVDLQHDINGIQLAAKIRETDAAATIVFVTTHAELAHLVFIYKVEALDYITKDSPAELQQRAIECMQVAYRRHLEGRGAQGKHFTVKAGSKTRNVPYDKILFFETQRSMAHNLILHMEDGQIEFRGSIAELTELGPDFFHCHNAFVVHVKNIRRVDRAAGEIEMINGETIPVDVREVASLLEIMSG